MSAFKFFLYFLALSRLIVMCLPMIFFKFIHLNFAVFLGSTNLYFSPNLGGFLPLFLQIHFFSPSYFSLCLLFLWDFCIMNIGSFDIVLQISKTVSILFILFSFSSLYIIQAYLRDIASSVPGHHNKANIVIHWTKRNFLFPSAYTALATWCKELTHLKKPLCWERLRAGGKGYDRGWDGWMASPKLWTWVWVNSESWWWTGKPGVLQSMGSQRIGHDWATELNWVYIKFMFTPYCGLLSVQ